MIFSERSRTYRLFFQKEQTKVKTRYAQNINSMLQCEYNSVYFVCRKPDEHVDGVNHNQNGDETNSAREQENWLKRGILFLREEKCLNAEKLLFKWIRVSRTIILWEIVLWLRNTQDILYFFLFLHLYLSQSVQSLKTHFIASFQWYYENCLRNFSNALKIIDKLFF